jgi:SAM-dependent methyltransferase
MSQVKFTHVNNVTGYMKIIVHTVSDFFGGDVSNRKILDMPAGNGWVSDALMAMGAIMVPADFNDERPDFTPVNMESPLPFADGEFDCAVCAEGIEHILRPEALFSELARVLKKGGLLIVTTPNVQNFFSRYQLACTGYLYQFHPFHVVPPEKDELIDRGHINPVFYTQLRYFSELHGLKVLMPDGDKYKRIVALPFFLPFLVIGYWWAVRDWKKVGSNPHSREIIEHLFSLKTMFSRSLIFKAVKR